MLLTGANHLQSWLVRVVGHHNENWPLGAVLEHPVPGLSSYSSCVRNKTKELWKHGFDNYMKFGMPFISNVNN